MKLFGFEIKKADEPAMITRAQIRATNPQGPMTSVFQDFVTRKVSGDFYEKLREGIPIIDAAISRLISLNGTIKIIGDNMDCVRELEDFCLYVPVNDTQEGIHALWQNMWNETFEQGFSQSEYIVTPDMKDIAGLRVADSKNIIYRRNAAGVAEPWYRYPSGRAQGYTSPGQIIQQILTATYGSVVSFGGWDEVKLNPANKIYLSINNENTDPYGVSLMRSMEWSAQILCTIQNSMKNTAERFGDPMYHAHLKHKTQDLEKARKQLEDDLKIIVNAKRAGGSGDIVTATGIEGNVEIKVVGHDGQLLTYDIPIRHVCEQLVSKTLMPAWMLGIYWSTTERMATLEVESVLQDAKVRQLIAQPKILKLLSTVLKIRGKKWDTIKMSPDAPGDWGITFEIPNLRDILAIANANFLNAQADLMRGGSVPGTQTSLAIGNATIDVGGHKFPLLRHSREGGNPGKEKMDTRLRHSGMTEKDCGCNKHTPTPLNRGEYTKELSRSKPWPELDKVEADYENELKYDWRELRDRVLRIVDKGKDAPASAGKEAQGQKDAEDILFTLSDEARAAVMKALEDHLGIYDLSNTDSPVLWYYGQAFSLGVIQAAHIIGEETPILDIIKNKEIFDEMCRTGFALLKERATVNVQKAIDFMEEAMLRGLNPKQVAADLAMLFDDKEYDWERLARSEMSMAAERAKLGEWDAWGVKMVEFTPAPDACAICFSLAGDYEISKCPVPVDSTHPNCRCSIQPARSEVDG